jgi:hypothetical protein
MALNFPWGDNLWGDNRCLGSELSLLRQSQYRWHAHLPRMPKPLVGRLASERQCKTLRRSKRPPVDRSGVAGAVHIAPGFAVLTAAGVHPADRSLVTNESRPLWLAAFFLQHVGRNKRSALRRSPCLPRAVWSVGTHRRHRQGGSSRRLNRACRQRAANWYVVLRQRSQTERALVLEGSGEFNDR